VFGFILGMSPNVHDGTWTELIAVPESAAICKPHGVDTASAGAAGLAAITAMSALDALGVSEGDAVLVVGANGGVGSFAVQLAADAGATVIAPALPEDEEYLHVHAGCHTDQESRSVGPNCTYNFLAGRSWTWSSPHRRKR
jgi:NADPH:quinone reductase-like Zn-dependent oxidoreductase